MIKDAHILDIDSIKLGNKSRNLDNNSLYKDIYTIRQMELTLNDKYISGDVQGFCHLVIGQENIYVALKQVLKENDKVIGSYRSHGLAYICGIDIKEIIGECLGKQSGNCKGKGGSMHLYNEVFYGGHGIVGAQVSLGTGIAFALKYNWLLKKDGENRERLEEIDEKLKDYCRVKESDVLDTDDKNTLLTQNEKHFLNKDEEGVCFVFYGDGASNQGQVFESFNMAKLWNLPVVYVVENNLYGMWTPAENACSYRDYYKRGINIPGVRVTDEDINILMNVFDYAKTHARMYGPIIVQIDTYRICPHSCSDFNERYRTKEEVEIYKNKDCLRRFRDKLNEEEGKCIEIEVEKYIKILMEDIEKDKFPESSELFTDVIKN